MFAATSATRSILHRAVTSIPPQNLSRALAARVFWRVVENHDGDTYRAVYTVQFTGVVYVLHVFQKKSKRRVAVPRQDLELIQTRLKNARDHYQRKYQPRIGRLGEGM